MSMNFMQIINFQFQILNEFQVTEFQMFKNFVI